MHQGSRSFQASISAWREHRNAHWFQSSITILETIVICAGDFDWTTVVSA